MSDEKKRNQKISLVLFVAGAILLATVAVDAVQGDDVSWLGIAGGVLLMASAVLMRREAHVEEATTSEP